MVFDVAIIGCGVSGASIARRLSAYNIKIAILEKSADVSFGTSKANSGIIHGGFHHNKKYLKARLEMQGSMMFDQLRRELNFPFRRCGIIVAALHQDEMNVVEHLYLQGVENEVIGIELCSRQRMLELEPKLSPDTIGGLYAPGGGIIEPYRFVFALVESAIKNGAELFLNFNVREAVRSTDDYAGDFWSVRASSGADSDASNGADNGAEDGTEIKARYVINAAGLYADEVSKIFGAEDFKITARKGEYYLLDRLTKACPSRVVFPVPTAVSKGMLVIPTVEGTALVGPTADAVDDKEDFSTTTKRLEQILVSGKTMIPLLSQNDVITSFAGLRPCLTALPNSQVDIKDDFYIEASKKAPAFIQVAGIQSPGLTASPAIAEYVKNILVDMGLKLTEKPHWNPIVENHPCVREMSHDELNDF
ncbi:MAG: FAD-dependent oxidoreductase, partial [Treponema sp.]|nr:FAD-dependent oxidoreductase [Treponema sp.]